MVTCTSAKGSEMDAALRTRRTVAMVDSGAENMKSELAVHMLPTRVSRHAASAISVVANPSPVQSPSPVSSATWFRFFLVQGLSLAFDD